MMSNFKQRLRSGEVLHGCWLNLGSLVSAEIVGHSDYDWMLIDLEHGAGDVRTMYYQLQVLSACPATPFVRIDDTRRPKVQQILDSGASGIMFPQIKTVEEARDAVSMMYYPPRGIRGTAKMVRATGFGNAFDQYKSTLDDSIIGVVQIETLESVEHIEEIAGLNGVDVLFVGPSDLTTVMNIPGQIKHPDYLKIVDRVAQAAQKAGKVSGVLLLDIDHYEIYFNLGYRFIACGADATFVVKGAKELSAELKRRASLTLSK
jgi:4-hydroxy-2-oxoheptanedioate aldolase